MRVQNRSNIAAGCCAVTSTGIDRNMLSLSDGQLAIVMTAASSVPVEKRSTFLERVAARLQLRGGRFTDRDLGGAVRLALQWLIQQPAA